METDVVWSHWYIKFMKSKQNKNKLILLHCWWECNLIQPLWKMVWRLLKKLGIKPPYGPAILLLGIYPEEIETEKDICTPMFTEVLFTIDRTWKQPRCPLIDELIKKLWYTYTMAYYSVIERSTSESALTRRTKPEPIIQSQVRKRNINRVYWHIYMESERLILMNSFSGKQWRNRHRERIYGQDGRRGGRRGDVWGK